MTPDELRRIVDRFEPPWRIDMVREKTGSVLLVNGKDRQVATVVAKWLLNPGRALGDAQALCDLINAAHDIASLLEKSEQAK